jgi:transposase
MKRFVEGQDRSQLILLPDCLDDYVGEDNPVRIVDALIDELDLAVLGFDGVVPEVTGRPAYHPSTLLKIYLYGYLNRVQVQPAARTGSAAQYRADVADRAVGARLQDDC